MHINSISNINNVNYITEISKSGKTDVSKGISFGLNFQLSNKTIRLCEKSTGLTYNELIHLSHVDALKLMKKRGTYSPNKILIWLKETYRKLGERLGILEKREFIYTDID